LFHLQRRTLAGPKDRAGHPAQTLQVGSPLERCPSGAAEAESRAFPGRSADKNQKELEMPKLKTKSGAKKRFKMTGTGKVKAAAQGKRHGMIKRTAKFVRSARGTMVLNDSDAKIVKKYMPYAR
jgi:large subunit ribosomal protein L35